MPIFEVCIYKARDATSICGLTREEHRFLLHTFIPSPNIVRLHIKGVEGDVQCLKCEGVFYIKEGDYHTCISCGARYQATTAFA